MTIVIVRRHAAEVLQGGRRVLLQKARALGGLALAPLLVVLVRLIRPFVTVRFGKLISARIDMRQGVNLSK